MKLNTEYKNAAIEVICLLFILLFVYAAVSKLLDFENFQVQLGQSPLLSAFAVWISWLVPLIEILIAISLTVPKWKQLGLFAAVSLMSMFTAYIYIILHYSSFVPCSCGGILEKMNWNVHLVFNILFTLLGVLALILYQNKEYPRNYYHNHAPFIGKISASIILSILSMIILFIYSEHIMHHENPFIRRYPQHPITLGSTIDLKFNSYYFSGFANGKLYLGNYTDPLHLLELDSELKIRRDIKIDFKEQKLKFKMVRIIVRDSYFYLMDGTVPCIFSGKISDWKISKRLESSPYFTIAEPIDSMKVAVRSLKGKKAVHVLGIFEPDKIPNTAYNQSLLKQQIDGVFDTDGMLLEDNKNKKIVYVYYYRNEFISVDQNGKFISKGKTIDTISHAQIKVAYLKKGAERKMSAPPVIVNQKAALFQNILFIQSKIPGSFEPENIWKDAAVIDVYNLENNSYIMSFAVYETGMKKLSSFFVTSTHLYAIMDDQLVGYKLEIF